MNEQRRAGVAPRARNSAGAGGRGGVKRPRKWAYGELSVSDIVAAACALIRREGVGALSMRRMADELGLSTMSMYYYVENKRKLLALVLDEVLRAVTVPPADSGTWDERLRLMMRSARAELGSYPGLVTVMLELRLLTPRSVELQEAAQSMITEAGFGDDPVALRHTITLFMNHLFGTVSWQFEPDTRGAEIPVPDGAGLDHAERHTAELFDFGLDVILDGLRARGAVADPSVSARPRRAPRRTATGS